MKIFTLLFLSYVGSFLSAIASEVPKKLSILPVGETIRGEVVVVKPPQEINKYLAKVEAAAKSDTEWFKEYTQGAKPGVPIAFHEKLGLSKEEYSTYMKLWDSREFQKIEDVIIQLDEPKEGQWSVRVSGAGTPISLMRYKGETFHSPNGELTALEDIDADERSVLGGWTGHEWRYSENTALGEVKENFAIGKMKSSNFGLMVYRLQEVTSSGRPIIDRSVVVRFPLAKK